MSEVEKLYRLAGVEKELEQPAECRKNPYITCDGCMLYDNGKCLNRKDYPPFTAKKQIAIIKLISKQGQVIIENWEKDNRGLNVTFRANSNLRYITMDCITRKTVEEALAQIVNDLWQDLTAAEQNEIREVLK